MQKEALKSVGSATLEILENGSYLSKSGQTIDIAASQSQAVQQTVLYRPSDFAEDISCLTAGKSQATIRLEDATTNEAALRIFQAQGQVTILNFASARNPGGGFLNGAKAQEEDLCRCSGLYPCLLTQPDYYSENRRNRSLIYTDHVIYSPDVPFFRIKGDGALLDEPYFCSVITAPAPNAAELRRDPDAPIRKAFLRRWAMVLSVAQWHQKRHIVLGAWGCGAFGNEASDSCVSIYDCLFSQEFGDKFSEVVFGIPNRGKRSTRNYLAFADELKRR